MVQINKIFCLPQNGGGGFFRIGAKRARRGSTLLALGLLSGAIVYILSLYLNYYSRQVSERAAQEMASIYITHARMFDFWVHQNREDIENSMAGSLWAEASVADVDRMFNEEVEASFINREVAGWNFRYFYVRPFGETVPLGVLLLHGETSITARLAPLVRSKLAERVADPQAGGGARSLINPRQYLINAPGLPSTFSNLSTTVADDVNDPYVVVFTYTMNGLQNEDYILREDYAGYPATTLETDIRFSSPIDDERNISDVGSITTDNATSTDGVAGGFSATGIPLPGNLDVKIWGTGLTSALTSIPISTKDFQIEGSASTTGDFIVSGVPTPTATSTMTADLMRLNGPLTSDSATSTNIFTANTVNITNANPAVRGLRGESAFIRNELLGSLGSSALITTSTDSAVNANLVRLAPNPPVGFPPSATGIDQGVQIGIEANIKTLRLNNVTVENGVVVDSTTDTFN